MRLTLVRHGETPANLRGELDMNPPGPGLTERGRLQAAALVDRFAGEHFDALYASNLVRTQETAAPLVAATGVPLRILSDLREFSVGSLEGRADPEAIAIFIETMRRWLLGDHTGSMGGGETGQQILDRMDAAMATIVAAGEVSGAESAAVFSHGGVLRVWAAARADNIDSDFAVANYLVNTAVVVVTGGPGHWHCESWDRPPER